MSVRPPSSVNPFFVSYTRILFKRKLEERKLELEKASCYHDAGISCRHPDVIKLEDGSQENTSNPETIQIYNGIFDMRHNTTRIGA